MRYGADHAETTRLQIIAAAAAEIRTYGPQGVSVARLMKNVGLTHGGFYAHFGSKNDLVTEAVESMFVSTGAFSKAARTSGSDFDRLRAFVRAYVSRHHRDAPHDGCPLATLANDIARTHPKVRAAFTLGFSRLCRRLADWLPKTHGTPLELAHNLVAQMVGAVSLARALTDPALSDAILRQTRNDLMARINQIESSLQ